MDDLNLLAQKSTVARLIRDYNILTNNTPDSVHRKSALASDHESQFGDVTPSFESISCGLELEDSDNIQRVQVAQVVRAMPLFLLFHASAAISIHNLTIFTSAFSLAKLWHAAVVFTGLALSVVFVCWRQGRWHDRPERVLRGVEVLCLLLGLVWAIPAAAAVYMPQQNLIYPIVGVSLAVLGISVSSFLRVPTGAIVFVGLVTAALAHSLYLAAGSYSFVSSLVCAIYGLVLVGIIINSHVDFIRRSRAEIEMKRQAEVIRLLLNDFEREAHDWLWETDAEGRLTYFSPRFAKVLNKKLEDLRLRPLRHILADLAQNAGWREIELAMIDEATINNCELELVIEGKPMVWQITAKALRDRRGRFQGYRGVTRDVTMGHDAKRRSALAMEASEKASAAKSQFLAVMSHELRTPVNAIMGFAELLKQDRNDDLPLKTRLEFSETIFQSSRQLQDLINNVLDITRLERGGLQILEQDVDAAELVEMAIKHCRSQAESAHISIVGRLTDGVLVRGDINRLKQVMVNLIVNAIKFSPPGGIINVDMQKAPVGKLVIAVKDAGIGISQSDLERVFEPFVQAENGLTRRFGGVGLGLPIARNIARTHGGDVVLESTPGAGASALLILPQSRVRWPAQSADTKKDVA